MAGFMSGNQLHKNAERAELAQLLADFQRRGGKVEKLGHTPMRRAKTRRQATVDEAASRIALSAKARTEARSG
ncbi:hypothetical protein BV378_14055 [Nostoc sp. RF31YmG]|nr:hypothetical protein BV378_14055 [Nostoc sp. RF31YmG]